MLEQENVRLSHGVLTESARTAAIPSTPPTSWRTAVPALPRPSRLEDALACKLFRAFSPRLKRCEQAEPPRFLAPFEHLTIPRQDRPGALAGTWFPAPAPSRGVVLLLHPWASAGRAYLMRHGRIPALRRAGYDVLTGDLGGFGGSSPMAGFHDLDVDDALAFTIERAAGRPAHLWGVSGGGVWAHPSLTRTGDIGGAFFEDVSPHLFEWSRRTTPRWRPFFALFQTIFPNAYRYLDQRRHAPLMRVLAAAYVSGGLDQGVRPEDTRELATLAGAQHRIIPDAVHLRSMKVARTTVVDLALDTFARAEAAI